MEAIPGLLMDLTLLSEFQGTQGLPEANTTDSLMSFFGPLLTHPQRVTFPWPPLHAALQAYFNSTTPAHLDPHKLTAGWSGLALIVTAFKRLEMLESESDMVVEECVAWLSALKIAAVRRSVAFESFEPPFAGVLQSILANLNEPVPAEQLVNVPRSRTASLSYSKPLASTSTSFERGSDSTRSPPASATSLSPEPSSRPRMEIILDRLGKRPSGVVRETSPSSKRRRGNSIGQISVLPPRARDSTVSTSALSSFADFSDHHDLDPLSSSDEDEPEEDGEALSNAKKIHVLAQRLSEVTGIPLARCIETISRFPNEDLSAINPNAPIPSQFLPTVPLPSSLRTKPDAGRVARTSGTKRAVAASSQHQHQTAIDQAAAQAKSTRHQRPHDPNRPSFSYSALIGQAILSTPEQRMRLSEIYDFVTENYPYYQKNQSGWQNSIRHNLSLQPVFIKIPDPSTSAGNGKKGCLWTILPGEEWRFEGGGWLKMDKPSQAAAKAKKGTAVPSVAPSPPKATAAAAASTPRRGGRGLSSKEEEEEDRLLDEQERQLLVDEEVDAEGEPEDGLFTDDELD